MSKYALAVYSPPNPGIPYLAVAISSDSTVTAVPAPNFATAKAVLQEMGVSLAKLAQQQKKQ